VKKLVKKYLWRNFSLKNSATGIFFHLMAVCNDKENEAITPIDFSISSAVIDIGSV